MGLVLERVRRRHRPRPALGLVRLARRVSRWSGPTDGADVRVVRRHLARLGSFDRIAGGGTTDATARRPGRCRTRASATTLAPARGAGRWGRRLAVGAARRHLGRHALGISRARCRLLAEPTRRRPRGGVVGTQHRPPRASSLARPHLRVTAQRSAQRVATRNRRPTKVIRTPVAAVR